MFLNSPKPVVTPYSRTGRPAACLELLACSGDDPLDLLRGSPRRAPMASGWISTCTRGSRASGRGRRGSARSRRGTTAANGRDRSSALAALDLGQHLADGRHQLARGTSRWPGRSSSHSCRLASASARLRPTSMSFRVTMPCSFSFEP